jgi:hypothetical protein
LAEANWFLYSIGFAQQGLLVTRVIAGFCFKAKRFSRLVRTLSDVALVFLVILKCFLLSEQVKFKSAIFCSQVLLTGFVLLTELTFFYLGQRKVET